MAAPTVRAVGAVANGTIAISPGLPAGTAAGDLLIMFIETQQQAITVSGWTECPSSPQAVTTIPTMLTAFYKIAAGGDATTTSDSGDHQIGRIIGIQAGTFDSSNPFNASAGSKRDPAGTTATLAGPTTTVDDCLIVAASSHDRDQTGGAFTTASWANANLTGITERINNSTNAGLGGGLAAATGVKASAGAVGNTTVTVQSSCGGHIVLAIAPAPSGTPHTLNLSDTITLSDAIGKAVVMTKADTITLADAITRAWAAVLGLADTITLSDAIGKGVAKSLQDAITLSDAATVGLALTLLLEDTITMSDALAKSMGLGKADTITLTDAAAKAMLLSVTDTINLSDVLVKSFGLGLADTLTVLDGVAKSVGKSATDTLTLSDGINIVSGGGPVNWTLNLADTITLTDDIARALNGEFLGQGEARALRLILLNRFGIY